MNILIVEDEQTNIKLLKFYVESFFTLNNDENLTIDIAENGLEALGLSTIKKYDLMFLDVKMPKFDGIKVLHTFKINKNLHKPSICMVTALGENKYKNLFKLLQANSFIIKPFDKTKVHEIIEKIYNTQNSDTTNDNFFNTVNSAETKDEKQEEISAKDFLQEYDNIDYMIEDIEEIDTLLIELTNELDIDNYESKQNDIVLAFKKYVTFLNSLHSFETLSNTLENISTNLTHIDISEFEELKALFLIELIRAVLEDLSLWKEDVFIEQNSLDVYSINTLVQSNYQELNELLDN